MNKNGIIVGVVILVVIVGGVHISRNNKNDAMTAKDKMDQKIMDDKKVMEEKDIMMKKDSEVMSDKGAESIMVKDEQSTVKAGSYIAYSADKIAMASTGDVVLFFHASWCPSCRGLNSDIEKNLSSIPSGVTILKTDYDTQTELKKKYGVTYQHTLVQVDKDGNLIKKWSGGSTLSNLLSQIQ